MACTAQSALDYVRNARVHLVRELSSLSVILENLYQQRVLTDEEVSKIQAEKDDYDKTRTMLDFVTVKGEAACYEFLKILDMTRKRTLGRPRLLYESKSEVSIKDERFDLHHWISCFSFKEDTEMEPASTNYLQGPRPCHRYQTKLKSKAQKKCIDFWKMSKKLFGENKKPDLSYTALVLDAKGTIAPSKIKKFKIKKSKMSRTKKLRTYIPEDNQQISPGDLLKTNKNILLVGKPGIGKTALTHEMLKLWSERDGTELDYFFYFDTRVTTQIASTLSLDNLLFGLYSEPDEGKDEVLQDIKRNSDNVTIIFDGITDLSSPVVQRLIEKDLLPNAKILITCRPDDEDAFFSPDECLRVEVKGFSEQTIKAYMSARLGEDQEKVLSSVELLTLCHVPMYALMVAACFSFEISKQPRTITEIYINIVRFCLQTNTNKTNSTIESKRKEILSLADVAFHATQSKTVNLEKLSCKDICILSFLKPLIFRADLTETITTHAFLHYTVQEFFAALWLLTKPNEIRHIFQQCLTDEMKHMKLLIPFMCRLLNERSPSLMSHLIPAETLNKTSKWFFQEMINTFFTHSCKQGVADTEDNGLDVSTLFLCQCLYESQCPEACVYLLDKLDFCLDLSGENLDPYSCCAVAYVVTQSQEKKICLNLEDVTVSEQGMRRLSGCLENINRCDLLLQQLWKIVLLSEGLMDHIALLGLDGNQLHLPVEGKTQLFEKAVKAIQSMTTKVNVYLYWDRAGPVCQSLCEFILQALLNINSLSFNMIYRGSGSWDQQKCHETPEREKKRLLLDLCIKAAQRNEKNIRSVVEMLLSLFPVKSDLNSILLDLYQHIKSGGFISLLPSLRPIFQSTPDVWSIDLSERKTSILLEVLKLQPGKKQVKLTGCSHEETEVRRFLQCLPYISQLSIVPQLSKPSEEIAFLGNLFCAAAEREKQPEEKTLELFSVCRYKSFPLNQKWCDFLLDLYSYDPKLGLSVLPSLQSVFQCIPEVWTIDLSERKASILLKMLKFQSERRQVKLTGCSHEESEVRSLIECLPYISQLSVVPQLSDPSEETRFFANLLFAAAKTEQQSRETMLALLSSVCTYKAVPLKWKWCDVLLDLHSYMTGTGFSVLPSLQPVFQSAPEDWIIDLSEGKTSILLEVLKLQPEKKQLKLAGWSHEKSEVRTFLQCLPYISQLSVVPQESDVSEQTKFIWNLFCAASQSEQQTREKTLEMLSSVCRYQTFPFHQGCMDEKHQCDFLLDLFSRHARAAESDATLGLSILPSLQSVFQSAPAVWSINLLERKTSVLLEVLKLQSEKKQVKLTGCSHEEREVKSFLLCLPYISQLSFASQGSDLCEETKFLRNLFCAAAKAEELTGEKMMEMLSSVLSCQTFPLRGRHMEVDQDYQRSFLRGQCDLLLDLYSYVNNCETKTSLSSSLRPVFQSAPEIWIVDLTEKKPSILLEVLKLQLEKKQVKLTGWPQEENDVRSFLQCLPYISKLSLDSLSSHLYDKARFIGDLFCAAAVKEQQTGERTVELLSSVFSFQSFPFDGMLMNTEYHIDIWLDLYSHVKNYEAQTGLRILSSLRSVFQSTPAVWSINLSERKTSILLEVLKLQSERKQVRLTGWSQAESEVMILLQCLPHLSQLSFVGRLSHVLDETRFWGHLFCTASEQRSGEEILELLSSVCRYQNLPFRLKWTDFLLDLYSCETETALRVLPVFQSAPGVWSIDLSERKASILLEVLKLQPEKKQVKLTGCSHEESEVRSFLQCLPHISQLSVDHLSLDIEEQTRFLGNLFCAAAEEEQQEGSGMLAMLSVCCYETFPLNDGDFEDNYEEYKCYFLLELYEHLKDFETKTSLSVIPSLESVFQSTTAVWFINLSERKTFILLEVLKVQSERKQVSVTGYSHEEGEVRSLIQCLPYISQLSFILGRADLFEEIRFFVNMFCAAAEREQQTGEKILEMLSSVCRYQMFTSNERCTDKCQCNFLLDLCSDVKDCEGRTGVSILPSLEPVFQSVPDAWIVDLSEKKTSILLEVLKLQSDKKQIMLTGCLNEDSEVRSFLQCLPYISHLSLGFWLSDLQEQTRFIGNLFCAAAVREQQTGERTVELLSSVFSFETIPSGDILMNTEYHINIWLDLYYHVKDYENQTGLRIHPSLQSVFQATPDVWIIDLSETKASLLLEVLKLQSKKKQVKLTIWGHEESEVRTFLQCLPFVSHLSLHLWWLDLREQTRFIGNLFCAAAEREQRTGERTLEMLSSVFSYETFPFDDRYDEDEGDREGVCNSLLDLCAHVKECENDTGLNILPSLKSVFQSAPAVWSVNLSERKTSILLEVLKLQSEKKQVKLTGCSHEESEMRSFLQCLPYISHLSVDRSQLLRFIHCCAASDGHEGAASDLLRTLQHRLDLSSSCAEQPEEDQILRVTAADCRAMNAILRHNHQHTQLHLRDCEVEDSGLDLLFPVLGTVRLRVSKTVLLRLLSLLPVNSERDTASRAASLCRALGGELDLSHAALDQRLCGALVQMLDVCEELAELNISHCRLTDEMLRKLIPYLHKVHVLDLSHNKITDVSADELLQLVSSNSCTDTVRLFSNNIVDRARFKTNKQFEIW